MRDPDSGFDHRIDRLEATEIDMTFLYLSSDQMGQGDEALGRRLLVAFLRQLLDSGAAIDVIGCVNRGVFLTTEDGPAAEILAAFAERGTRVASCGTCLDHYERREALRLGEVGSMDQTVAIMTTAERVIRP